MAACAFRRERPDESSALARPPDGASNGHQDYQDEKRKTGSLHGQRSFCGRPKMLFRVILKPKACRPSDQLFKCLASRRGGLFELLALRLRQRQCQERSQQERTGQHEECWQEAPSKGDPSDDKRCRSGKAPADVVGEAHGRRADLGGVEFRSFPKQSVVMCGPHRGRRRRG